MPITRKKEFHTSHFSVVGVQGLCRLAEMMIVAVVCRLSASAELPWIRSTHLVISASKVISGEVFLLCFYYIFLGPANYKQLMA